MNFLLYMDPFVDVFEDTVKERSYVLRYEVMPGSLKKQLKKGDQLIVFTLDDLLEENDLRKIFVRDQISHATISRKEIEFFLMRRKVSAREFINESISERLKKQYLSILEDKVGDFKPDVIYGWGMVPSYLALLYPEALILEGEHSAFSRIFGEADCVALPKATKDVNRLLEYIRSNPFVASNEECNEIKKGIEELIATVEPIYIPEFENKKGTLYFYPGHFPSAYSIKFGRHNDDVEVIHDIIDKIPDDGKLLYTKHPLYRDENRNESLEYYIQNNDKILDLSIYSFDENITIRAIQSSDIVINSHSKSVYLAYALGKPVIEIGNFFTKHFESNDEPRVLSKEQKQLLLWHINSRITHPLMNAGVYRTFFEDQYNFYRNNADFKFYSSVGEFLNLLKLHQMGLVSKKLRRGPNDYDRLKASAFDNEIECICTDVFDTLLLRSLRKPSDLFYYMSGDVSSLLGMEKFDFFYARINAEWAAKKDALNKNYEEATLDEIYEKLSELYKISSNHVSKIKDIEIAYEKRFLKARETMRAIVEFFAKNGKRVIAVSDMYLKAEDIQNLLVGCGYSNSIEVISSANEKVTKKTGLLYRRLINKYRVNPARSIFIGDNIESDIQNSSKYGFTAFHMISPMERYKNSVKIDPYLSVQEKHSVSSYLSVIANRMFDNPFVEYKDRTYCNSSYYLMGYQYFGPFLSGFVSWLTKALEMTNSSNKKILFCSRDCALIKKIFDLYSQGKGDTEYFYLSRASTLPLFSDPQNAPLLVDKYNSRYTAKEFVGKYFGKDCSEKDFDVDTRQAKSKLASYIAKNYDDLIDEQSNKKQISNLKAYISQIVGDKDFVIVDSGARGTSRDALSDLLGRAIQLYLLREYRYKRSNLNEIYSWHKESFNYYRQGRQAFISNFYEPIISNCCEGTCQGYEEVGNNICPRVELIQFNSVQSRLLMIQKGILDFCRDVQNCYGNLIIDVFNECSPEFLKAPIEALHSRQGEESLFENLEAVNDLCGNRKFELLMPALQRGTPKNNPQVTEKEYRKPTKGEKKIDHYLKFFDGVPILSNIVSRIRQKYISTWMLNN